MVYFCLLSNRGVWRSGPFPPGYWFCSICRFLSSTYNYLGKKTNQMLEAFERKDFSSALNCQVNFFPSHKSQPFFFSIWEFLASLILPYLPSLKSPSCLFLYFPSVSYFFLFKIKPVPIIHTPAMSNQDRAPKEMTPLCSSEKRPYFYSMFKVFLWP